MVYRNPSLLTFATQNDQATSDDETLKPNTNTTPKPIYVAPTPANPDAFNMFAPADLPPVSPSTPTWSTARAKTSATSSDSKTPRCAIKRSTCSFYSPIIDGT